MYSSSNGDARSSNTANARESASSMPPDHSSGAVWDRPAYGRDKFDRADRDRYSSAKKDWSFDSKSSSHRSLFSSSNLPGQKRRALGRHGHPMENGRYGTGSGRTIEPSFLRSPTENGKSDRDLGSPASGHSPGYNGNSVIERSSNIRESHLSPGDVRPVSSPRFDPSPRFDSRLHGSQGSFDSPQPRDRERVSKFSYAWDAPNSRQRDFKDRYWGRSDYHRRTTSLPKLDSPRDWGPGDRELLEGRIDRYGSPLSRETSLPEILANNSKDNHGSDWRSRDRSAFRGLSSSTANCSRSINSSQKDLGNGKTDSDCKSGASPTVSTSFQSCIAEDSARDESGLGGSTNKRPRLTWGQGLAKYEREKTEEHPSKFRKSDESTLTEPATGNTAKDISGVEAELQLTRQHDTGILCDDKCQPCHENKDVSGGLQSTDQAQEFLEVSTFQGHSVVQEPQPNNLQPLDCSTCVQPAVVTPSMFTPQPSQPSQLQVVEDFLRQYDQDKAKVSKDVLTQNLEIVELEIDLIEKELCKLDNGRLFKLETILDKPQSVSKGPLINSAVERGHIDGVQEHTHISCEVSGGMLRSADDSKSFCASILSSNQKTAEQAQNFLSHLSGIKCTCNGSRLYCSPQEVTVWKVNEENHERKRPFLQAKVAEDMQKLRFTERVLAVKYRAQREAWKHAQQSSNNIGKNSGKDRDEIDRRHCPSTEALQVAKKLAGELWVASERAYVRMPSMVLEEKKQYARMFETKNSLVENPIAVENERKAINPWTEEEQKIFLDKYSLFGKDFRLIASFLDHKTVADCVQFYYRNHKNEEFQKVHRRNQLRKRRESCSNALYLATTTSASSQQRESNAVSVEGLTLVAVAAAAMAGTKNSPKVGRSTSMSCTKGYMEENLSKQPNPSSSGLKGVDEERSVFKVSQSTTGRVTNASQDDFETQWTDNEREMFLNALGMFGKDFNSISEHIGTKSQRQCKTFFSKARKRLGLDQVVENFKAHTKSAPEQSDGSMLGPEKIKAELVVDQSKPVVNPSPAVFEPETEREMSSEAHEVDAVIMALNSLHGAAFSEAGLSGNSVAADVEEFPEIDVKKEGSIDDGHVSTHKIISPSKTEVSPADVVGGCTAEDKTLICGEILGPEPVKIESSQPTNPPNVDSIRIPSVISPVSVADSHSTVLVTQSAGKDRNPKVLETKPRREPTSWTQEEKEIFMDVLKTHGRDWARLCESLPCKSLTQIKTYFQNSKAKLSLVQESTLNINGRLNSSRKRKVDDSDSSSNAGSTGQSVPPQKVTLFSEDSNFIPIPTNVLGSSVHGAEVLGYANMFRSSLDDSLNPVFHSITMAPNVATVGILPMFNPNMFAQPNFHGSPHQSYVHPASIKSQPMTSHLQGNQLQQQQAMTRVQQEPSSPSVPHLHKQTTPQQVNQQALIQQQEQQAILQQQVLEATFQQQLQPQLVQRQHQQLQLAAKQASQLQQVLSLQQAVNPFSLTPIPSTSLQIPPTSQQQQQPGLFHSQVNTVHTKTQTLQQQQQQQQQQISQLQHLQLLQLHLQQQQTQVQQSQESLHLQNFAQLQNQGFSHLNEQQQQLQLAFLRGVMQSSKAVVQDSQQQPTQGNQAQEAQHIQNFVQIQNNTFAYLSEQQKQHQLAILGGIMQASKENQGTAEPLKQCDISSQSSKQSPIGTNEDLNQPHKQQASPESYTRSGDVKLFGQSLLSQPTSCNQQSSGRICSGLANKSKSSCEILPAQNNSVTSACHQPVWPTTAASNNIIMKTNGTPAYNVNETVANRNDRHGSDGRRDDLMTNQDHVVRMNMNRGHEGNNSSRSTGIPTSAPHSLPRVLNALVALAEWRLQNSTGGSGRLTDEFLSQFWETLQRDPVSLLEVGKITGGSLSQVYAGGSEMLNQLKEAYSQYQFNSWAGSGGAMPVTDNDQLVDSTLRGQNPLRLEETGVADVCDLNGRAIGGG